MSAGGFTQVSIGAMIPFLLLFAADDVTLFTQVEGDGSCLRKVELVAPTATRYVEREVRALVPGGEARSGVVRQGEGAQLWRDSRYANPSKLEGLEVRVLRSPFSPVVRYQATERIAIQFQRSTRKELAAAAETTYQYRLRLPGTIEEKTVQPAGGVLEGDTVTWTLTADRAQTEVSATSSAVRYDFLALVIWILLAAAWIVVRLVLQHRFRVPATI